MKETIIKNVVGYFRVSTEEQANNFSIDGQKQRLEGCTALGYNLLEEYTDKGIHEPIIDMALWERTQEKLKAVGKTPELYLYWLLYF